MTRGEKEAVAKSAPSIKCTRLSIETLRMPSHVYLLASRPYGTLYLGVTSYLGKRIVEHRHKTYPGFSAHYGVDRLVWMEPYERIIEAIAREKMLKK